MTTATLDDKTQKIFDSIKELSFVQTASLVKAFEEEFGITASAPVAVAAAPAGGGAQQRGAGRRVHPGRHSGRHAGRRRDPLALGGLFSGLRDRVQARRDARAGGGCQQSQAVAFRPAPAVAGAAVTYQLGGCPGGVCPAR